MNEDPSQRTLLTHPRTRAIMLAALAGLALIALLVNSLLVRVRRAPRPQPGDPAPEFTLTTFGNAQIALQDLRGQIVVLYFWASWAAPCRREAPGMEKLWQDYKDQGVTLIGIASLDAQNASRDFMRDFGPTFPNGTDPFARISSQYGVADIPETFIIDPGGQVAWVRVGEISADELAEQLDRLVGGEAVKSPATLIQEIDVIAQRLHDELTAGAISECLARRHVVQLAADGRWLEFDHDDRARTHWSPGQHPERLAQLAAAYSAHLHSPTEADELEQAILSALGYWVEHDPQSDNWWFNSIHTPKYLAQTLLLMGDAVPKPIGDQATTIVTIELPAGDFASQTVQTHLRADG